MRSKERILQTLEEADRFLSQRELARRSKVSRPTAKAVAERLAEENVIEIEQVGNTHLHRIERSKENDE